jgi:uncharacterized membrane protein
MIKIIKTIIYIYIVNRDLSNTPLVNQKNSNISYISNNKIKTQEITWNVGNDKIFLRFQLIYEQYLIKDHLEIKLFHSFIRDKS